MILLDKMIGELLQLSNPSHAKKLSEFSSFEIKDEFEPSKVVLLEK